MAERNDHTLRNTNGADTQGKNKLKEKSNNLPSATRQRGSIALLVFLYVLQGIPLGLAGAMPMLLQTRKVSYKDQATFSLVFWPFSMKLLWAPIVDTAYFSRFGRRKSWLLPVQYLIGIFLLILSVVSFSFFSVKLRLSNSDGGLEKQTQGGRQIWKTTTSVLLKGEARQGRRGGSVGIKKGEWGRVAGYLCPKAFPVFVCNTSYKAS